MRLVRLYADRDGQSHFEDLSPRLQSDGNGEVAPLLRAEGNVYLRRVSPGQPPGWHNAPQRQFVVILEGDMEVEASDGTSQKFGPGDVLLVEDMKGAGHVTRTLGSKPRVLLNIPAQEAP